MEENNNQQNNVPVPGPVAPQAPAPAPAPVPVGGSYGEPNKLMGILSYLGILILIPLLTPAKDDPFVKFHIKQGLVLIIAGLISFVVGIVPIIGWMLSPIISIVLIVLTIIGIVNVINGQTKELPIVGKYASNFNF